MNHTVGVCRGHLASDSHKVVPYGIPANCDTICDEDTTGISAEFHIFHVCSFCRIFLLQIYSIPRLNYVHFPIIRSDRSEPTS